MDDPIGGMSDDLLKHHSDNLGLTVSLLNFTSNYLMAPDGSGEEELAEAALQNAVGLAAAMDESTVGNVMLALCSLVVSTTEPVDVQEWFNAQAQRIAETLEARES